MTHTPGRTTPALDIVVCTCDPSRLPLLRACLDAVQRGIGPRDTLTVVVDHCPQLLTRLSPPTGEAGETGADGAAPPVTVVENTRTRGLSGARNTGLTVGGNPVVCFLDDDAVPSPGWSEAVRGAFDDPDVIGVGGRVEPRFTGPDGVETRRPRWIPASCDWIFGCDRDDSPVDGETLRNPVGAAMAVRREALADLPGSRPPGPGETQADGEVFREDLGRTGSDAAGGEETELFQRLTARQPGHTVRRVDAFHVRHTVPASRTRPGYVLRRSFMEGRSKAAVSGLPHTRLGVEREHLRRVVTGAAGELCAAVHGDHAAPARILTTVAVAAAAGLGFLTGRPLRDVRPDGDHPAPACPAPSGPAPSGPEVSVVVCTDDRGTGTGDCLVAVSAAARAAGPRHPVEIVLVDNSTSGRLHRAATLRRPEYPGVTVRVVREPVRGLSRARNTGVRACRGRVILFTDDDALVAPDWVTTAVDAVDRTGADCVTGRVLAASLERKSHRIFEAGGGFDKGPVAKTWTRRGVSEGRLPPVYPYPGSCFGSGNNMAFTRQCLNSVGGFAEELGAGRATRGGEDLDMFRRVILSGGTVFYEPGMVVRHRHRAGMWALTRQIYGHGTGMAASLARCALDDRGHARAVIAGLPTGFRTLLASRRVARTPSGVPDAPERVPGKVPGKSVTRFPRYLTLVELVGYCTGVPLLAGVLLRDSRASMGQDA